MVGTLYVVATPIGNLEDLTQRAVRILSEVDLIAAEDTRHSRKLLTHYGITKPLTSYHGHNEEERTTTLLQRLQRGESVALISDAGTPGISDPGFRVIRAARAANIPVVPIPGPSAMMAALCAAGVPTTRFTFVGFLPEKRGRREALLAQLAQLPHTIVMYIARWDVKKYLPELLTAFGNRQGVICRELTKRFEEFRGDALSDLSQWAQHHEVKGEITLIIEGGE